MNGAKLRARLAAGESIFMTNPHHVSSGLVQRLIELGSDAVFLDCEHGSASFEDVRVMSVAARSAGGAGIARPDSHQRSIITRYLNVGADGVMVPLINTAAEAQHVVDAVRFACPTDYDKRLVIAMVETVTAVSNLKEILSVEGIDVFFVGPGDMSQSMGYPPSVPFGEERPEPVIDKVAEAVAKIRAAGKIAGTLAFAWEMERWVKAGVQFFYVHSDPFLRVGLTQMRAFVSR
jgi:4-hydroxy-2-oxoheptanedioate aldolase